MKLATLRTSHGTTAVRIDDNGDGNAVEITEYDDVGAQRNKVSGV